jgi:hypothetical protein
LHGSDSVFFIGLGNTGQGDDTDAVEGATPAAAPLLLPFIALDRVCLSPQCLTSSSSSSFSLSFVVVFTYCANIDVALWKSQPLANSKAIIPLSGARDAAFRHKTAAFEFAL